MAQITIEGRHPVLALLEQRSPAHLYVDAAAREEGSLRRILSLAAERGTPVSRVERRELDRMSSSGAHMGVIARLEQSVAPARLETILEECAARREPPFLLALPALSFEQNVGAVIRTANAAGAHGLILGGRRKPFPTGEIVRVSTGAVFSTPVVLQSIYPALKTLRSAGVRIVGADVGEGEPYSDADLAGSVALVLGTEDRGLSDGVKRRCDALVRIPMRGVVSSLNVSVACGVLAFEKLRQDRARAAATGRE